jgi:hypothetical protein
MTPAAFRKLALSHPETEERQHMNHPDFRGTTTVQLKAAKKEVLAEASAAAWRNVAPRRLVEP